MCMTFTKTVTVKTGGENMNVIDAMIEANDRYPVRRKTWPKGDYVILTTRPYKDSKICYHSSSSSSGIVGKEWQPTEEDLLATDWEFA